MPVSMAKDLQQALNDTIKQYSAAGIQIDLQPKRVKNINFRLKSLPKQPVKMVVSYPPYLSSEMLVEALIKRFDWAMACDEKMKQRQQLPYEIITSAEQTHRLTVSSQVYYQGRLYLLTDLLYQHGYQDLIHKTTPNTVLAQALLIIYRQWLCEFIERRQDFWQQRVGQQAQCMTPYRMKTRWGSCSPHTKTIRLSIWLAQFVPACTDYVMVHELCHLHHANHSAQFWQCVAQVMPDYQRWHRQLASSVAHIDEEIDK